MRLCVLPLIILTSVCAALGAPPAPGNAVQSSFASAESMMQAGRMADAAQGLERIVRSRPDFSEAYFALGVCYAQLGKPAEATAALRSYLKRKPESADGHAILGNLLFHDGRIAEALPELERAVHLNPAQSDVVKLLARVYNLEGNAAKAVALMRPLVASPAADDESRTILARALLSTGDAPSAVRLLDGVLAANPHSPLQTYILAVMAARDAHDLPGALEICERGQAAYPNSEQLEGLAVSLPEQALITRTSERIEQIKKHPDDVAELVAVGRIMTSADRGKRSVALDLACALLARAVHLEPDNAGAWYHYGRCLTAQAKPEDADAAFRKALAVVHDDELRVLILGRIGFTETRLNHFDDAEAAFRSSLELNRKLDRHISESALLYYRFLDLRDRDADSRALLAEILRWEPLFAPALLERAKHSVSEGQPEKATDDVLFVVRNTEDPETLRSAHYLLVRIYRMTGNAEQAEVHAEWIKSH
jgi:tetratricopeptide (TPR) repeat protein